MEHAIWFLIVGTLLIFMAVTNSFMRRLPLSPAMIYLAVGFAIGPNGLDILHPDHYDTDSILVRITEIALLISLFSSGLKLRQPFTNLRWRLSVRLAVFGLILSTILTLPICLLLGFPFAVALLISAMIAPTDPVLAAEVQVKSATDQDHLRFSLTGESGLNDGIAFPLVLLALQLLSTTKPLLDPGKPVLSSLISWFVINGIWNIGGGVIIGVLSGLLIGQLVLYLRTEQQKALGLDEFLVLGLIAISYSVANLIHASPFLAVFFAGLSVGHTTDNIPLGRTTDHMESQIPPYPIERLSELAVTPELAVPLMMRALRGFNEQLERIAEVAVVIMTGALLGYAHIHFTEILICIYTFFIARPVSAYLSLIGTRVTSVQRKLIAWFGVRGIGSMYYILFSLNHGLPSRWVTDVFSVVVCVCASSIIVHGISVTPLMNYYRKFSRI